MRTLALSTALSALALTAAPAMAQQAHTGHHQMMMEGALLTVSAEGQVEGAPDIATVNMGVTTEGRTAQEALQANSTRMDALVQTLRRAGVAERDIQTSNISVNPQYVYGDGVPPRITGYQASNTLNARVRNLARVGAIMDAAISAGGNTLNGVSFGVDDPEPRLNEARREAMTRARARADLYAQAAGMRVNRILSISEGYGAPPMPVIYRMEARAMDGVPAPPPPVAPGEITTSAQVTVVFELR